MSTNSIMILNSDLMTNDLLTVTTMKLLTRTLFHINSQPPTFSFVTIAVCGKKKKPKLQNSLNSLTSSRQRLHSVWYKVSK